MRGKKSPRISGTKQRQVLKLDGGFKDLLFSPPTWGNDSHFDEHIFQMGWFNHQLVNKGRYLLNLIKQILGVVFFAYVLP